MWDQLPVQADWRRWDLNEQLSKLTTESPLPHNNEKRVQNDKPAKFVFCSFRAMGGGGGGGCGWRMLMQIRLPLQYYGLFRVHSLYNTN